MILFTLNGVVFVTSQVGDIMFNLCVVCTYACTDIDMLTRDVLDFVEEILSPYIFSELCCCSFTSQFLIFL